MVHRTACIEHPGRRITESGYGTAPVLLVAEGGALLVGDALAPFDESRTRPARDDFGGQRRERGLIASRDPRDQTRALLCDAGCGRDRAVVRA